MARYTEASLVVLATLVVCCSTMDTHTNPDAGYDLECDPEIDQCGAIIGQALPLELDEFEDVEATDAATMNLLQHGLRLQSERALLSQGDVAEQSAAGLGCKFCWCTIVNALKCGTSTVTDVGRCGSSMVTSAAKCGEKTVNSIGECGSSVSKICSYGRRRRWSGLKCNFRETARSCLRPKTCSMPNTCDIASQCDVAESFSDCFREITSDVSSSLRGYVGYITDGGCNSVNSCKNAVLDGLDSVWSFVEDEALGAIPDLVDDVLGTFSSGEILTHAARAGAGFISTVQTTLTSVAEAFAGFTGGALPGFTKPDFGSVCTPEGAGFWGMVPTECGAFSKLSGVFTNIGNAPGNFNAAVRRLGDCAQKQGLFGFPTPFFDLSIEQYCMPAPLVTAVEYMVGAVAYTANVGQSLATQLSGLISQVKDFAENELGLFQLAKEVHALRHRRLGTNVSLAQVSSGCGTQTDWGVDLMVTTGISAPVGVPSLGQSINLGLSMGIGLGCASNNLVDPNWIMGLTLQRTSSTAEPAKGASGEVGLEFSFHETYPAYANRVAGKGFLEIVPQLELTIKAVEVGIGLPINFAWVPNNAVAPPSSFTFGAGVQVAGGGSATLAQSRAEATVAEQLTKAPALMQEGLRHAASTMSRQSVLKKAAALDEHQGYLLAKANEEMMRQSTKRAQALPIKPDISISAGVNFMFCLTPGFCNSR